MEICFDTFVDAQSSSLAPRRIRTTRGIPRCAAQEEQLVVLRHEEPHRRRCGQRPRPHRGDTAANVSAVTRTGELMRDDSEVVYGDFGYTGVAKRPEIAGDEKKSRVTFLHQPQERHVQDEVRQGHRDTEVEAPLQGGASIPPREAVL